MEALPIKKRLTREESRAQTRDRLLESAYQVFVRDGIEGASIEDVAEEAGYSRGAFYSNFESKDDLVCALMEREIQRENQRFEEIMSAKPSPEQVIQRVREYYVSLSSDKKECAFWLGLHLYAVRNPAVRPRTAEMMTAYFEGVITQVRRVYAASGKEPPVPQEIVAFGLIALAQGMGLNQMLYPRAISPEVLPVALGKLFDLIAGIN